MAVKVRMNFKEPNGRKFSKTAEGADLAEASAYAGAIAALTSGTLIDTTVSSPYAGLPLVPATGSYSDATFHFRKGDKNINVHFEQLDNGFAEEGPDGNTSFIGLNNGDIMEYATRWSTANGGGWVLVEGHYVR